jgi:serine/threonine protein kinase
MSNLILPGEIQRIDPRLRLIEPFQSEFLCCRVQRNGNDYVLKAIPWSNIYSYGIEHEIKASRVLSGVPGIVRVSKIFNNPEYAAILKEYVPGQTLLELGKTVGGYESQLRETIQAMHDRGISLGDIALRNILISLQDSPLILDLGQCMFAEDWEERQEIFEEAKKTDWLSLERIL